jgi:hypothetical protein
MVVGFGSQLTTQKRCEGVGSKSRATKTHPKGPLALPKKEATTEAAAEFREETSKMQQSSKTGLLRWTQSAIRLRLATQLCAAPDAVVRL